MDYQCEDEYNWYQEQRRGVKRYEMVLACVAFGLLIVSFVWTFGWCLC